MWSYDRRLQYPVKIKNPNPALAKIIVSQLGGPDGELGASQRYLNQRFTMPDNRIVGMLTDIGTEAPLSDAVRPAAYWRAQTVPAE